MIGYEYAKDELKFLHPYGSILTGSVSTLGKTIIKRKEAILSMGEKLYEIHIKNHLDNRWAEWFQADEIKQLEGGVTVLLIRIPDQPALHGLLERIRDLNLTLISVNEINTGEVMKADNELRDKGTSGG